MAKEYTGRAVLATWDVLSGEPTHECVGGETFDTYEEAKEYADRVGRESVEDGTAESYRVDIEETEKAPVSDAKKAANARYDKRNTRQVVLKLNLHTDADILAWLDMQDNKQGEIKWLIREQIRREAEEPFRVDVRRLIAVYGDEGLEPDIPADES